MKFGGDAQCKKNEHFPQMIFPNTYHRMHHLNSLLKNTHYIILIIRNIQS